MSVEKWFFTKEELEQMYNGEAIPCRDNKNNRVMFMSQERFEADIENRKPKSYGDLVLNESVDMGFLQDWYQNSVDNTQDPVWTDEHLRELTEDFYVIPKEAVKAEYDFKKRSKERSCKNLSMSIDFIENQIRGIDDRKKRVHYDTALMAMQERLKELTDK